LARATRNGVKRKLRELEKKRCGEITESRRGGDETCRWSGREKDPVFRSNNTISQKTIIIKGERGREKSRRGEEHSPEREHSTPEPEEKRWGRGKSKKLGEKMGFQLVSLWVRFYPLT